MVCKNCGKALGNNQATCPFCGAFISSDQIDTFKELKKEKEKDLRPKLISERYGVSPIQYEQQNSRINNRLIVLFILLGVFAIVFFIVLLFLF